MLLEGVACEEEEDSRLQQHDVRQLVETIQRCSDADRSPRIHPSNESGPCTPRLKRPFPNFRPRRLACERRYLPGGPSPIPETALCPLGAMPRSTRRRAWKPARNTALTGPPGADEPPASPSPLPADISIPRALPLPSPFIIAEVHHRPLCFPL